MKFIIATNLILNAVHKIKYLMKSSPYCINTKNKIRKKPHISGLKAALNLNINIQCLSQVLWSNLNDEKYRLGVKREHILSKYSCVRLIIFLNVVK